MRGMLLQYLKVDLALWVPRAFASALADMNPIEPLASL